MNLHILLALRYLSGRKLRTFLTTAAIVFGVLMIFGMNTLIPAFQQAFQASAMAMAGEVDVTITHQSGEAFAEDMVNQVASVGDVRLVSPLIERGISLPADYLDGDPAVVDRVTGVTLVGMNPDDARAMKTYSVLEGRFLEGNDRSAAVVTESLLAELGLQLGDQMTLPTPTGLVDLTIVGVLPQRILPGNEEVLVTLPQAQAMLDMPGKINTIEANYEAVSDARRAAIETEIKAALGPSFSIGALQAGAEILTNIQYGQIVLNVMGALGILMGGFIIFNTFRTIIAERRRDIGMLRAVGASATTISGIILTEGLIQGIFGTVLGLLLGYGLGVVLLQAVASIGRQYLNIAVGSPVVTPGLLILAVVMGIGITIIAGLLPARAASRITPLEVLRPSVGKLSLRRLTGISFWLGAACIAVAIFALLLGNPGVIVLGGMLIVLGLILIAPALVAPIAHLFSAIIGWAMVRSGSAALAEGNLSRQPSRAAITASTTMIALAVVVMAGSLASSLSLTFDKMLRESLSSEYLIVPPSLSVWGLNVGASPDMAEQLRAVEGVEVVSTLRFAGTKVNDIAVGLLGIDPQAYNQTSGLTFTAGDPDTAFAEMENGRNVIVNGVMAASTGATLGSKIELLTTNGPVEYTVVGIAGDYLNAKTTTAYITQANLAADFGRNEDVFFQINLREGADAAKVESKFHEILRPYPQFKLIVGQEFYEQNAGMMNSLFAGLFALLLFLAIPSLIAMVNTLAIGVIERTREIGMLRAVGADRGHIRTIILVESLLLAGIGTAFGLLSGLYLGYMVVNALSMIGFEVSYIFPAQGVILALAGGLLFGVLAAIIPARQAARLEIVQALRFE